MYKQTDPSPAEIKSRCKQFQAEWTQRETLQRLGYKLAPKSYRDAIAVRGSAMNGRRLIKSATLDDGE